MKLFLSLILVTLNAMKSTIVEISSAPEWWTFVATLLVFVAGGFAGYYANKHVEETRQHVKATREQVETTAQVAYVDRTLNLHREFFTGEVQEAKRRLSDLLWYIGGSDSSNRLLCYQPLLDELMPRTRGLPPAKLAEYPEWVIGAKAHRPLDDVFLILGAFERIRAAKLGNTLDTEIYYMIFSFHVAWWNRLFVRLVSLQEDSVVGAPAINPLRELALDPRINDRLSLSQQARIESNFELVANSKRKFSGFDAIVNEGSTFLPS
jgi:hypothetical protein